MSVEPEKWGVIYNPKAGTRKVQRRWKEIKEYRDSRGVSYDYVQSEGFGSVERLSGILANNGYRTIVAVSYTHLDYTIDRFCQFLIDVLQESGLHFIQFLSLFTYQFSAFASYIYKN